MPAETTLRAYLDAFDAADVDAIAALYADTTHYSQPFLPAPLTAPADIRAFEAAMHAGFSDVRVELQWLVAGPDADEVAAGVVVTATHTGAMALPDGRELAATGTRIRLETAEHLRVDDVGRIVEHRRYSDSAAFLQQLIG